MQVQGNTFIVTGGSSGLGAGTAERLVEQGANVIIADVNEEMGGAKAAELGERAVFVQTDVTSEESVQRAIRAARDQFGSLEGAINCAGILIARKTVGRDGAHDLEGFTRVITVNLIGTFNVIRLAAAAMSENEPTEEGERGVLINTASVAAYEGQMGQAAYSASKGGVVGMTLPIARDLSRNGIRCMTIAPGIFETPMVASMPAEVLESLISQIPFPKRLGKASDFAFLVQHILENVKLNGEVIRLDGGVRMGPR